MRSRTRTCSSPRAPCRSKAPKACLPSTRTWQLPLRCVTTLWRPRPLLGASPSCLAPQSRSGALAQDLLTSDPVDLRSRDRELTEIAKSIASLAELFKDLSALVIDQGTLLDSVEYNIEQTAVQMSEAVRELDVATRSVPSPLCPCLEAALGRLIID